MPLIGHAIMRSAFHAIRYAEGTPMSNLRRFLQRLYDKSLDPKVDVLVFIVALALGVLCLWVVPPSIPPLVQRLIKLLLDTREQVSNAFVVLTFALAVYIM